MTGLKTVTPEERLLETMRYIREMAHQREWNFIWGAANDALLEYEAMRRVQQEPRYSVICGEIQSKGGR